MFPPPPPFHRAHRSPLVSPGQSFGTTTTYPVPALEASLAQRENQGLAIPTILLIRHAQASYGAADYDVLSQLGAQQVTALVDGLERRRIVAARVICGGLRRQRDTAAPCATALGVQLTVDRRFDEYDDRDIMTHYASVAAGLERQPRDRALSSREFQQVLD
ncbi:MAG: histidine phosphatase family protein, partial [Solirubrobacteraceae bacterium]